MISMLFSGAAPAVHEATGTDLITYLQNGGKFHLGAEPASLIISALLLAAAAAVLLVSAGKEKSGGKK